MPGTHAQPSRGQKDRPVSRLADGSRFVDVPASEKQFVTKTENQGNAVTI